MLDLQFGLRVSEQALEALGTEAADPIVRWGTSTVQLRRMVHGASRAWNTGKPWRLYVRTNQSLRDLKRVVKEGWYPLVDMYEGDEHYHQVVVLGVEQKIRIFDPARGKRRLTREEFLAQWGGGTLTAFWYAVVRGQRREE